MPLDVRHGPTMSLRLSEFLCIRGSALAAAADDEIEATPIFTMAPAVAALLDAIPCRATYIYAPYILRALSARPNA